MIRAGHTAGVVNGQREVREQSHVTSSSGGNKQEGCLKSAVRWGRLAKWNVHTTVVCILESSKRVNTTLARVA